MLIATAAAACSSSSSTKSGRGTTAPSSQSTSGALTASYKGVTADTIKLGFAFPDLAALAKTGLLKVDNGDYEAIAKALVADVNAHGGVNGRRLELTVTPYSVLNQTDQLAGCTKLTEDVGVFAILGGFLGDNNLCSIQQHKTMVIYAYGAGFNQILQSKAQAPFTTFEASDERSTKALVQLLDQQGSLKGKTIGVYATPAAAKPLVDLTVKDLQDAGYTVTDTAVNDVAATDAEAFTSQEKLLGNRFKDKHIDTVIVQVTVPPGANWDAIGYHPTMYSPQTSLVTSGSFVNGYGKFPLVAGVAPSADPNLGYNTPAMQHCRAVWKQATGKDIETPVEEQKQGKSTGFAAMSTTCTVLQMFVDAAKAAGPNLTYDSWQKGLDSLGTVVLAAAPVASFAPNKPDGQDSFQLMKFNPAYKPNSGIVQLLPIGAPIKLPG